MLMIRGLKIIWKQMIHKTFFLWMICLIIWKGSNLCFYLNLTYSGNSLMFPSIPSLSVLPSQPYPLFMLLSTLSASNINWLHLSCKQIHVTSLYTYLPIFPSSIFSKGSTFVCFFHSVIELDNYPVHLGSNCSPPVPAYSCCSCYYLLSYAYHYIWY